MVAENRWYVQRLELGFAFSIDLLVASDDSSLKLIFCAYRYCVGWRTWQFRVYIWNVRRLRHAWRRGLSRLLVSRFFFGVYCWRFCWPIGQRSRREIYWVVRRHRAITYREITLFVVAVSRFISRLCASCLDTTRYFRNRKAKHQCDWWL